MGRRPAAVIVVGMEAMVCHPVRKASRVDRLMWGQVEIEKTHTMSFNYGREMLSVVSRVECLLTSNQPYSP